MKLVAALDLAGGVVVRGTGGHREAYRPLDCRLSDDPGPTAVAAALRGELGLDSVYLADLDAIAGRDPAWEVYEPFFAAGLRTWLDAGLCDTGRAARLKGVAVSRGADVNLVAGLETVASPALLKGLLEVVGPGLIFSVDLRGGAPLGGPRDWPEPSPAGIARSAAAAGVRRFVVLDVARVGLGGGVGDDVLDVVRELHRIDPKLRIAAGGGVRDAGDVDRLAAAGCEATLVGSALFDGRIGRAEIERLSGGSAWSGEGKTTNNTNEE